jgi:hypothetical protein
MLETVKTLYEDFGIKLKWISMGFQS